jgi:hypothetical protein
MRDVFVMTAEATAQLFRTLGYAVAEVAGVLEDVFLLNGEAIVGLMNGIGYGLKEIKEAIMVAFDIDEGAAMVIMCVAFPPPVCLGAL